MLYCRSETDFVPGVHSDRRKVPAKFAMVLRITPSNSEKQPPNRLGGGRNRRRAVSIGAGQAAVERLSNGKYQRLPGNSFGI